MHGKASGKIGLAALACLLLLTLATPVAALEPQAVKPDGQPAERGDSPAREGGQAESGRADEPQTMQPAEPKVDARAETPQSDNARSDNPRAESPRADNPRPGAPGMPHKQPPALTAKQQKELAKLYKDLYGTQKKLIGKYADYGVITREQAAMWLNRLEARYEKLKENGYLPVWRKCDKKSLPQ